MDGQLRIDSVWAFTQIDTDGTEGIMGMTVPGLGFTPLLGADLARVRSLRPYAQQVAASTGRPVVLSHYSVRTDQETIQPCVEGVVWHHNDGRMAKLKGEDFG